MRMLRTSRRRGGPPISIDADLQELAVHNAEMVTPADVRTEPVVAVLLDQAVSEMSRRFREDRGVRDADRAVARAQNRLDHLDADSAPAVDPVRTGSWDTGATAATGPADVDAGAMAAEVEQALAARAQQDARAEVALTEQQQQAAEQTVVDALVGIAQRTRTAANRYLAALNRARGEIGRQALPLLGDEIVDELFTRAVRQPEQTPTNNGEADHADP